MPGAEAALGYLKEPLGIGSASHPEESGQILEGVSESLVPRKLGRDIRPDYPMHRFQAAAPTVPAVEPEVVSEDHDRVRVPGAALSWALSSSLTQRLRKTTSSS